MNSRERFIATVERKPVDRPACWLGDPTPEAVPALCDYYHVDNIKELKKVCGDIAYMMISDMYGCPESISLMEMFYQYITEEEGLNKKADLFGFSRGGLYHLTDESALEFKGNPLDKMDQLLRGGIRIMLVAGAVDSVVPYQENGANLARYYEENGGQIKVIVKPDCDHHPHSLEDPTPIIEYIAENFEKNKK